MTMRRAMVIVTLLLAGCAGQSDEPCERPWDGVGEADGKLGLTEQRLAEHQALCPGKVDEPGWRRGYQNGLAWYCRPEHLYLAGREGGAYQGVCPNDAQARKLFLQGSQGWTDR
ncbi:DUF2799 domain-containing protein [Aeromonas simiae]|uniref:DUF2799 domain-containing protein n=1 Tax=Aeromonas simiae TaxID=218936 RepID=UPI0012ECC127